MEPPVDGVLYRVILNLFRFAGAKTSGGLAWLVFKAEGFYVNTVATEEYAIVPAGSHRWRPASGEMAASINPEKDLAVVHLSLKRKKKGKQ